MRESETSCQNHTIYGHYWLYEWNDTGMLKKVTRPDGKDVTFKYDALGRRIEKTFDGKTTKWIWDGNVPIHEWTINEGESETILNEKNEPELHLPEDKITWIFEEGGFAPMGKIQGDESFSIITDYLGTPCQMYNDRGRKTWECELDIYGKIRYLKSTRSFNYRQTEEEKRKECPFRYQGQYEDVETGLYYNRFRYYDPEDGVYVSQDPIGLEGDSLNLYGYVFDVNSWIDILGLNGILGAWGEKVAAKFLSKNGHQILGSIQNASGQGFDLITKTKDGFINIIEVKSSKSFWRSKSNMAKWTNDNISKIKFNQNGRWANMPLYQKNLIDMVEDANTNGTLRNKLLQINVEKRSIRLKCK